VGYCAYDVNGYVGDIGTATGLFDFMRWCAGTEDFELINFSEEGKAIVPEALLEALQMYEPPKGDIKEVYDALLMVLPKCKEIVVISDGLNDDLEDFMEE